jgi:sec-independent protein translocase protein TatB
MFDIGFAELLIIAVVSLLVIGPERLPGTIRTVSAWISRLRRGFNDIKQEVQQELHNDSVMQELRETGEQLKRETDEFTRDLNEAKSSFEHTLDTDADNSSNPESPDKDQP